MTSGTDLTLSGQSYMYGRLSNTNIFSSAYRRLPTGTALTSFTFYCDVTGPAFNVNSDLRLKSDVRPLSEMSTGLDALSTVSYRLVQNNNAAKSDEVALKDSKSNSLQLNTEDRTRFGFIAQEVKEVYPNLVSEDENGFLSVDYMGFIPLLVEEVKGLRSHIEEQDKVIESLKGNGRKGVAAGNAALYLDGAVLGQNRPNPFTANTVIECTIPQEASTACIIIYDLQGIQIRQIPVEGKGKVAVSVDGGSLNPGMYIYTLLVDDTEIDTKRMILTE